MKESRNWVWWQAMLTFLAPAWTFLRRASAHPVARIIFKYALGLSLLGWTIAKNWKAPPGGKGIGISDLLQRPLQTPSLVLALAIVMTALMLTFVRWYVLVRAVDLPFTMFNALRLGLVGFFFNSFLPGSVGGDIVKAVYIAGEQRRRTTAVATVLIDRVIGLWALACLVALLGSAFWLVGTPSLVGHEHLLWIVAAADALVLVSAAGWLLLGVLPQRRADRFAGRLESLPKFGRTAAELWRAIWMYRCRARSVLVALGLALLGHLGFVLAFYFAAQTFLPPGDADQIPTLAQHFVIVPIGMTVAAFVPTPGGVGVGEYSFGMLYELLDKPEANGVIASLVGRIINWGLGLLGYLIFLRMRPALCSSGDGSTGALLNVSPNGPHNSNFESAELVLETQPSPAAS